MGGFTLLYTKTHCKFFELITQICYTFMPIIQDWAKICLWIKNSWYISIDFLYFHFYFQVKFCYSWFGCVLEFLTLEMYLEMYSTSKTYFRNVMIIHKKCFIKLSKCYLNFIHRPPYNHSDENIINCHEMVKLYQINCKAVCFTLRFEYSSDLLCC